MRKTIPSIYEQNFDERIDLDPIYDDCRSEEELKMGVPPLPVIQLQEFNGVQIPVSSDNKSFDEQYWQEVQEPLIIHTLDEARARGKRY